MNELDLPLVIKDGNFSQISEVNIDFSRKSFIVYHIENGLVLYRYY